MKNLLILLLLCYHTTFAQQTYFFTLLGQSSKTPVAYAAIWVKNKKIGAYANEKGEFALDILKNDTLMISSVGYENLQYVFTEVDKQQHTILLKEKINELPIVTVSPNPKKEEQVGFFNVYKRKKEIQFSRWLPAMEVAAFIPNGKPNTVKYIKSINLNVKKGSFHKGILEIKFEMKFGKN